MKIIYYGTREAMVSEVAAFDPTVNGTVSVDNARYLVLPSSDNGDYDTIEAKTIDDALEIVNELKEYYTDAEVCKIE